MQHAKFYFLAVSQLRIKQGSIYAYTEIITEN